MAKNRLTTNILVHGLSILIGVFVLAIIFVFTQNKNQNLHEAFNAYASTGTAATDPNLKIAFIGDQGLGANAEGVLSVIKQEGTSGVVHAGDFDYSNNPAAFDNQITKILGATYTPYFGAVGNHDEANWTTPNGGYKSVFQKRNGSYCTGVPGEMAACNYKGLLVLELGIGNLSYKKDDPTTINFIKTQLAQTNAIWRVCMWHRDQNAMQTETKGDEIGWQAYEECRKGGAIIATGHAHSYERTKTLNNMQTQTIDPSCPDGNAICVVPESASNPGKTFAFVSGIGKEARSQGRCLPSTPPYGCKGEWAKIYSGTQGAKPGALFITFNYQGNPYKAHGYFKNINNEIIDEFDIYAATAPNTTGVPTSPPSTISPTSPQSTTVPTITSGPTSPPAACKTSNASWQTISMSGQTGTYTVEFDATPVAAKIDTVMGLSSTAATAYANMAAIVRFAPTGVIDARNGSAYQASTSIPYTAGIKYHFKMIINSTAHTYSANVTPNGGSEITIGTNYAFRTEQAAVASLPIFNIYSAVGSVNVCGLTAYTGSTPPTATPGLTSTPNPTPTGTGSCTLKSKGDANCDNVIDVVDFEILRKEVNGILTTKTADFNSNGIVDVVDFEILRKNIYPISGTPTTIPTTNPTITSVPTITTNPPTPTFTPTPIISVSPKPGSGVWVSQAEIAALPMSGAAWTDMKAVADGSMDAAELYNQNSHHPQQVLAVAYVYARTGNATYATKAKNELMKIAAYTGPQTSGNQDGRSLALGRNLAAYVIAADAMKLSTVDPASDQKFRSFLTNVRKWTNAEGRSLIQTHEVRPNNWGTMAGASRIAADLYLNDTTDLARAIQVFKGYLGDRTSYASFEFRTDTSLPQSSDPSYTWMCSTDINVNIANARPINPASCVKNGHDLSGAPPGDMDREGAYTWPPRDTTEYPAGAISAAVAQAELLYHAGYDSYNWEQQAIGRAMKFIHTNTPKAFTYPTDWMEFIVNKRLGTSYSTASTRGGYGRLLDWTAWTHAK